MIQLMPQTNRNLCEEIQRVGCFFRSAQAIAEMEAESTLSPFQINAMWLWAKEAGLIDESLKLKASAPIANKTLEVLRCKDRKFIEIATSNMGVPTFYKSIPKELQKPKYFIRKILNQFGGTHFLVVDKKGKTIFDPDNSAIEKKEFYTICYTVKKLNKEKAY